MKFDIVIGNPPYNDINDSNKPNGRKFGSANYFINFIHKSKQWSKEYIMLILPLKAWSSFKKADIKIQKQTFNQCNLFSKDVNTITYYCGNGKYNFKNTLHDKIFDFNRLNTQQDKHGYYIYNYVDTYPGKKIWIKSEYDKLLNTNRTEWNKFRSHFDIIESEQNLKNLIYLINYFQEYLRKYNYMLYSFNKRWKYKWIENINRDITEKDIINYYRLTPDDVKEIKG